MDADVNDPQSWTRADSVKAVISLFLGVAPILFIVLEWSVAWWTLGHRPRPMVDDPKWIGELVSFLHWLSLLALMALILIFPWSALHWMARHGGSRGGQLVALGCFLFPLSTLVILYYSNFEPIGWWMD
ncbi:hypothetical protein OKA05_09525 [Luteolibacter arcticus]|uniref:Uncharacterized protein n=1 Tax=Luteolibacter arcticus TaxID=1581411 RepID=A0ABT3GGT0_9BACT|nr:hypothetical protein [Luteolibacter arcticus]MCW1922789.1 hypothetical protein [Luteolibacter arcticus]